MLTRKNTNRKLELTKRKFDKMGRKGPCLHCGINSLVAEIKEIKEKQQKEDGIIQSIATGTTPLWRQGPEEKAVLCNACGSRYRKWGNLQNYLPKKQLMMNNLTTDHAKPSSNPSDSDNCCRRSPRLWKTRIPSKKRSKVVHKRMTPMQKFHRQLLDEWMRQGKPNEKSSPEEVLMFDNVNNFIPGNEIGLGAMLLKPDAAGTSSSA